MVSPRPPGLDLILPLLGPARIEPLARTLFSALLSDHRPLAATIVCRAFPPDALARLRAATAPLQALTPDTPLRILEAGPDGTRATLLNLGLAATPSRHVAFLDDESLVYPEAYPLLVAELERSAATLAFGAVLATTVSHHGLLPYATAKRRPHQAVTLRHLLEDDVCPLPGLVIDRGRLHPHDLVFDETLPALEHYDLLLRLCARYPSSFALANTPLAEQLQDVDAASDPIPHATLAAIHARKPGHLLTPPVQSLLGLDTPGLTTAAYLAHPPRPVETPGHVPPAASSTQS